MFKNTNWPLASLSWQDTMMDHPLRTISYIADIGNMVVLMARRKMIRSHSAQESLDTAETQHTNPARDDRRQYKMICHVFESEDVSVWTVTPCTLWKAANANVSCMLCSFSLSGSADCSVHWSGLQRCISGVFESQWHWSRGPEPERVQRPAQHSGHVQRRPHSLLQVWKLQGCKLTSGHEVTVVSRIFSFFSNLVFPMAKSLLTKKDYYAYFKYVFSPAKCQWLFIVAKPNSAIILFQPCYS